MEERKSDQEDRNVQMIQVNGERTKKFYENCLTLLGRAVLG